MVSLKRLINVVIFSVIFTTGAWLNYKIFDWFFKKIDITWEQVGTTITISIVMLACYYLAAEMRRKSHFF